MITEDYVSFEVAKLLKEKGFDERTYGVYDSEGGLSTTNPDICWNEKNIPFISAPTHQMTLKWLREAHNLHIDVFIGITADDSYTYWTYFITDLEGNMIVNAYGENIDFKGESYEQTIDSAIKYCLTNLIK